jgi:hypothetical protein
MVATANAALAARSASWHGVVGNRARTAHRAAAALDPAAQALLDLYLAHREGAEDHRACFARLGARTYAALLDEALDGTSGALVPDPRVQVPLPA